MFPMDKELLESIDRKMSVILSLLIEQREIASGELNREKLPKIEVVLKKTGFDAKEVAYFLGKKVEAVRKTLQRAK